MSNTVYNINEMERALKASYESGNRRAISRKDCQSLDISDTYFKMYLNLVESCYLAVADYVRIKHSHVTSETERKKALNAIYPRWKELLECGEEQKFKRQLHCSEHDISDLVGFAQKFMDEKNNVEFEADFVARKVIATETLTQFRKKVETLLGFRMAEIAVLSDDERDFLNKQRRIIAKIRKINRAMEVAQADFDIFAKKEAQAKDMSKKEVYQEEMARVQAIINECQSAVDSWKNELKALVKPEIEALQAA